MLEAFYEAVMLSNQILLEMRLMDNLDIRIISLLQEDGKVTNAGVARQVGVSEETIRRRLKRLVQEEYIKVVTIPDPKQLGYESEVLIGIQADTSKVDDVADTIAKMDEVNWVSVTTGSYNIFAWATLRSTEELSSFLRTKVGAVPGVGRLETFINLSIKKRKYGVAI